MMINQQNSKNVLIFFSIKYQAGCSLGFPKISIYMIF